MGHRLSMWGKDLMVQLISRKMVSRNLRFCLRHRLTFWNLRDWILNMICWNYQGLDKGGDWSEMISQSRCIRCLSSTPEWQVWDRMAFVRKRCSRCIIESSFYRRKHLHPFSFGEYPKNMHLMDFGPSFSTINMNISKASKYF